MKERTSWVSPRLGREVSLVRWGTFGRPVLIFPTAGGDAEEIERFHIIDTLKDHLAAGTLKIFSVDNMAGRSMLAQEGSLAHRMWVLNEFQHVLRHEVVPAICADCRTRDIGIATAGSSIGAFQALSAICRFPDVFTRALCMSGTYDLERFLGGPLTQDFWYASPLHWLGECSDEALLDRLRSRFVLLASGEGRAEDIGESWRVADVLGRHGVPNRVDSWGPDWDHDWPLWRNMLHRYAEELIGGE